MPWLQQMFAWIVIGFKAWIKNDFPYKSYGVQFIFMSTNIKLIKYTVQYLFMIESLFNWHSALEMMGCFSLL